MPSLKKPHLLLAPLLLLSLPAQAETTVYFFGGHGSTTAHVSQWKASAQSKAGGGFRFIVFPWLGAPNSFSKETVLENGASTINAVAEEILKNPQGSYVIAGHSSGSAASNAVAEKLKANPAAQRILPNIRLIAIDGFSPSSDLQKSAIKARCWWAKSPDGFQSPNGRTTQSNCGPRARMATSSGCETQMCLHFRLINLSAPRDLSSETYGAKGYSSCNANIEWLTGD